MNALFRGSSAPVTQFSSQRPKVRGAVCQKLIILAVTPINRKAWIHHKPTLLQLKYLLSKSRHWEVQTMNTESASCPQNVIGLRKEATKVLELELRVQKGEKEKTQVVLWQKTNKLDSHVAKIINI